MPGRVVLDRVVDVLADVRERDDLVALRGDLARGQAEQRGGEVDVGEPRVLRVEARSQLEQRADAAADERPLPRVGWITPATTFSSVDLPAPFSPIMPSDSPRRSSKLTPSSARNTCAAPRPRSRSQTRRTRPPRASTFA